MKNKVFSITVILFVVLLFLSGCTQSADDTKPEDEKPLIIATLFPQYDFLRQIAGEKVEVILLLPPGVEPHTYEPTPRDIADIKKADMFVYTGEFMEPWAERIIYAAEGSDLLVVDTSIGIELMDEEDHHHHEGHEHDEEHEHEHEHGHGHDEDHDHEHEHKNDENHEHEEGHHHHGGKDPHFWLDPIMAQVMVDHIIEGLVQVDPDNEGYFRQNGEAYKQKLQDLHEKLDSSLAVLENRTILYAGHFAFGYFAARYNLANVSPYEGFAPDAEPTPGNIAELIKRVEESNTKVIYYEELIDPKVARVVAEQTGAEMMLLHGAHNVTTEEMNSGVTYISIMEDNLARLLKGLE